MKEKEIQLIKDLYKHFQPQTEVNDELINSCFEQYGSIRGVLMNLVLKFEPNADVTDEYLDKKLSEYGLLTTEANEDVVEEEVVAPVESSKVNEDVVDEKSIEEENVAPVETKKVEVKDLSGAGDTFMAGLVVKFMETDDIDLSIKYANECASKVVTQKGVAVL